MYMLRVHAYSMHTSKCFYNDIFHSDNIQLRLTEQTQADLNRVPVLSSATQSLNDDKVWKNMQAEMMSPHAE